MSKRKWKRVDDVVYNFMNLPYCANLSESMKKIVAEAARYGFRAGNSYGRYSMWGEMYIKEALDRISRAEEIQRYTENRCEVLEKENAELKAQIEKLQKEKEGIIHQEVVDMYSRFPC